jgi:ABC-type uncharacterized transport system permease subunit
MNEAFAFLSLGLLSFAVVGSLLWVARDAAKRGRSAVWITFLCFATWPLGFLIWRGVRPPPPIRKNA